MSSLTKLHNRIKGLSPVTASFAGILLVASLAIVGFAWISLVRSRAQYINRAEISTRNLGLVLADNLVSSFDKIDLVVLGVKDEMERQLTLGRIDGPRLEAFMDSFRVRVPAIHALRIVDANGIVEYGNLPPGPKISLADRAYFMQLKANPKGGLVFSAPLKGRVTDIWTVMLARRINRPNGSFGGIVYGAINLGNLSAHFASISIGLEGEISLLDSDLNTIVSRGGSQEVAGQLVTSRNIRTLVQRGFSGGSYTAVTPHDHVGRVYSFSKLQPYGQFVNVGFGMREVLEPWRRELHTTLAFVACYFLLIGVGTWITSNAWRRQQQVTEQLKVREALLAEVNHQLLEANLEKNKFLGLVVHDLRNPLGGIVLAAQVLFEEDDLGQVSVVARQIFNQSMEMSFLIERFLDVARIDSGKMMSEPEPCDLVTLVRKIADGHLARCKQKDIMFSFQLPESGVEVYADPKLVKDVMDNLISNALKFSHSGTNVMLRVNCGPDEAITSVEDQGPGLTDEDKKRLFGRFERLSAKPTGGEKSIGLGLSIVKYMVETMGGRIWVDTKLGEGTAFRVALPLAKQFVHPNSGKL